MYVERDNAQESYFLEKYVNESHWPYPLKMYTVCKS